MRKTSEWRSGMGKLTMAASKYVIDTHALLTRDQDITLSGLVPVIW